MFEILDYLHLIKGKFFRTHPGSEFVVAYTIAKWKKLERNEFDFSQGSSQKGVSRMTWCSVFKYGTFLKSEVIIFISYFGKSKS